MLTFFTIPKSFKDLADVQQRNAIQSWLRLTPECQIILCGDDPSVIEAASELGVESMPAIRSNEFGTPFLDSVFSQAYEQAKYSVLCYVNSDIILMESFTEAIARIKLNKFLAVGQRTDLDLTEPIDFEEPSWHSKVMELSAAKGELHSSFGIDYFVFSKNSNLHKLPPFLVGRPRWDNWFIYNARKLKTPIVDLTPVCQVIHQNHNYAHIPQWKGKSWNGPESEYNNKLYHQLFGNQKHICNTKDATNVLTDAGLKPAFTRGYLYQRLQTSALLHPILRPLARMVRSLYLHSCK
ncbi:MAG TPA: hypothetical protein GXZ59_08260 [Clostridiaceae bacterium]|nr:hypothetical protein [Clostridiaceae bacterium]